MEKIGCERTSALVRLNYQMRSEPSAGMDPIYSHPQSLLSASAQKLPVAREHRVLGVHHQTHPRKTGPPMCKIKIQGEALWAAGVSAGLTSKGLSTSLTKIIFSCD